MAFMHCLFCSSPHLYNCSATSSWFFSTLFSRMPVELWMKSMKYLRQKDIIQLQRVCFAFSYVATDDAYIHFPLPFFKAAAEFGSIGLLKKIYNRECNIKRKNPRALIESRKYQKNCITHFGLLLIMDIWMYCGRFIHGVHLNIA